ncbi:MAG: DMT family transporter [Pseudomonadota bacterium]
MAESESRGLLFALAAVTTFSMMDGVSKHLASEYNAPFVIMIRYHVFTAFVLVLAMRRQGGVRAAFRTRHPVLQWLRGGLLGLVTMTGILLFAEFGLAESHAIFASAPLIVAALSMPLLGERVGWRRWSAIVVGFIGVLIILQPGAAEINNWVFLAMSMAIAFSFYAILTRLVSRDDDAWTSFFYTAIGGTLVVSLIGPFYWVKISLADWGWMAALCVLSTGGHYLLIRAIDEAPPVIVQPMAYLQTVLASAIGITIYNEELRTTTIVGAVIVIGAGVFIIWREHQRARAPW